ncbi:hypothetical protein [Cupriavidus malaysiensis]|uniref:Uncharacterized protein n=1 Tax=Cupriavidus malaysiensis TaxID=367825 RepID=A0ABN4TXH9_9BURK|nr:hypothetical protein [Cupriavidus malaysiensis]AOZ09184.1 hypothetical protein BKK80_25550 [Cupriavidus malaysiensis]
MNHPGWNEHGRRQQLARFGYRTDAQAPAPLAFDAEWSRLQADFPCPPGQRVPTYAALDTAAAELARQYMRDRFQLDSLLNQCDAIHADIVALGPHPEVVERYASARDAFEDAVERFGVLRGRLQSALAAAATAGDAPGAGAPADIIRPSKEDS